VGRLLDILEICRPNRTADSIVSVDVADLKSRGIEALLLDLDNTLVPWHGYDVPVEVVSWLRDVEKQGVRMCIVSNTRYPGRLRRLAEQLRVPFVKGRLKPLRSAFRPALELLQVPVERAAVVGDQIFTDILGGNRLGLYTVLVKPMGRREFFGTRISRFFERLILKALAKSSNSLAETAEEREQSAAPGSQSKSRR